jgi:predicted nucleic acid-binding Zn ribbon protein
MSPRRPMRRLGEVLPELATRLGIEPQLRLSRQMAAWRRLVAELVPAAAGESELLALQPPALVVSAASSIVAQELNLRSTSLLEAFANSPDGIRLLELRVVGRRLGSGGGRLGGDVD